MNSNMVKPEKFDHLHLVYHFTEPLTALSSLIGLCKRDILTFTFKRPYFLKKKYEEISFKFFRKLYTVCVMSSKSIRYMSGSKV